MTQSTQRVKVTQRVRVTQKVRVTQRVRVTETFSPNPVGHPIPFSERVRVTLSVRAIVRPKSTSCLTLQALDISPHKIGFQVTIALPKVHLPFEFMAAKCIVG